MSERILIKIEHKEIEFTVKETPDSQYSPYQTGFSRKGGDWWGSYSGFNPKAKEDIKIIEEALQKFIDMGYTEREINIVKSFVDELRTTQLELF